MSRKALADMTDAEFERFLKREGITGIGAANLASKRHLDMAVKPHENSLKELARLVAKSEEYQPDLAQIEALSAALDYALSLIPGWKDSLVKEAKKG